MASRVTAYTFGWSSCKNCAGNCGECAASALARRPVTAEYRSKWSGKFTMMQSPPCVAQTHMTVPVLLAVVEVPYDERVRCAAEGCGHSVYRRVHLVRVSGSTNVYGSDCFMRLFGSTPTGQAVPRYGNATGRSLTPEERALLVENTDRLIEQFEQEHQAQIAEVERRREQIDSRQAYRTPASMPQQQRSSIPPARSPPPIPTPTQRAEAEIQARRALAERFPGVNLDLPGFKGLVGIEIDKILRVNAA